MWSALFVLLGMVFLLCLLGYQAAKSIFDEPREYHRVIVKTYEPNPRPYAKKEITDEIREKAEFEVLD